MVACVWHVPVVLCRSGGGTSSSTHTTLEVEPAASSQRGVTRVCGACAATVGGAVARRSILCKLHPQEQKKYRARGRRTHAAASGRPGGAAPPAARARAPAPRGRARGAAARGRQAERHAAWGRRGSRSVLREQGEKVMNLLEIKRPQRASRAALTLSRGSSQPLESRHANLTTASERPPRPKPIFTRYSRQQPKKARPCSHSARSTEERRPPELRTRLRPS